jgi:hypothetical protein
LLRGPAPIPTGPIARWRIDVVHNPLADGRPVRILTVVDHWSRWSPEREARFRMTGETVSPVLARVLSQGRSLRSITVDHGTEFQSRALADWADRRSVPLDVIRPGKPVENAVMESLNGRLRDECLNGHQFTSLAEAQAIIEAWRMDYHHHRPTAHSGTCPCMRVVDNVRRNRSPKKPSAPVKDCLGTGPTSITRSSPYGPSQIRGSYACPELCRRELRRRVSPRLFREVISSGF